MKYKVYGDYGFNSETLLAEFDRLRDARAYQLGYTALDTGGFDRVEVLWFTPDGEAVVEFSVDALEAA